MPQHTIQQERAAAYWLCNQERLLSSAQNQPLEGHRRQSAQQRPHDHGRGAAVRRWHLWRGLRIWRHSERPPWKNTLRRWSRIWKS